MNKGLERREFLAGLAAVMGGVLVTSCSEDVVKVAENYTSDGSLQALSNVQILTLEKMVDTIIPKTDTPGAVDVEVHYLIDHLLANQMGQAEADKFIKSLNDFIKDYPQFSTKSKKEQFAIIQKLDSELWAENDRGEFYRSLKELTLIGYYTSEVGATLELEYDPVPGPFHQVSIEEYSRTWAT